MTVEVQLLGRFTVSVDGEPVPDPAWPHRRPRDLVQLLALSPGRRLPTDEVLDLLWPDLVPTRARANLHKAAHLARRAIGLTDAVVLAQGAVRLLPDRDVLIDAEVFAQHATAALRAGSRALCDRAVAEYPGDLLPCQPYSAWAEPERHRLRALHGRLLGATGDHARAAVLDPLDEPAQVALMRGVLDEGRPDDALRRYATFARATLHALGVAPGAPARAVRDEAARLTAPSAPVPPLVGRDAELATARRLLRGAAAGAGGVLLLEGEAGIGKTHLWGALVSEALDAAWPVARTSLDDVSAPYHQVLQAFRRLVRHRPDVADPDPAAVLSRLDELTTPSGGLPLSVTREGRGEEVVTHLAGLLVGLGPGEPAMLAVDDTHRADEATLDLLWQLGQLCLDEPVVLLLAHRTPAPGSPMHGLRTRLLRRGALVVGLSSLDPEASATLLRRRARHPVSDTTTGRLVELGEGNPLLLGELAATVLPDGTATGAAGLDDVVLARLDGLSAGATTALQQVAVSHQRFTTPELSAVTQLPHASARQVVEEGLAHDVLVPAGDGHAFRHALIREALARQQSPPARRSLHRAEADRLARAGASPDRVAHHLERCEQPRDAVPWLLRAGGEAAAEGRSGDALSLARRGLRLAPGDGEPELLELQADAQQALGDPTCVASYLRARHGARPERHDRLLVKQAYAHLSLGDVPGAQDCLSAVSDGHTGRDLTALQLARGYAAWLAGDVEGAAGWARRARERALAEAHDFEAGQALLLDALVAHSTGRWRLAQMPRMLRQITVPELVDKAWDPHLCIGIHLVGADEPYADLATVMRTVASSAADRGSLRGEAFALTVLGGAAVYAGEVDDAESALTRALRLQRRTGSTTGQSIVLERMASLAQLRGEPDRAVLLLDDAELMARTCVLTPHLMARVHTTRVAGARSREAADLVARGDSDLSRQAVCAGCSPLFLLASAGACLAGGDSTGARSRLERVRAMGPAMRVGVWAAAVSEIEAGLARARGEEEQAARLLASAAHRYRGAGHVVSALRCEALLPSGKDPGRRRI